MTNIITQNPRSRVPAMTAALVVFGGLYALSRTLLQDVYLFEWTSRELYLYIWIPALILAVLNKTAVSYAITLGNLAGVIIGQLLGDFIISQNAKLITPDTTPDREYFLTLHQGVPIWVITALAFTALGIVLQIISSVHKRSA